MKTRITRRYLAGLLDGEGYFGIMRNQYKNGGRHFVPTIKMALGQPEVLTEIAQLLGGHIHIRRFDNPNWNDAYMWESRTFVQVGKVLDYVHKYLIIKKSQAGILQTFLDTKTQNLGCVKTVTPDVLAKRKHLYCLIKKLNHRGICHPQRLNEKAPDHGQDEATVRTALQNAEISRNACPVVT